jgi:signal transduction histidine kinase
MTEIFTQNIIIVFFFYGLAFFSMGLAVLLELGHSSELDFARSLRPLAGFGLVHGFHEWFEMMLLIHGHSDSYLIDWLRLFLLAASFFMLVTFGARLIVGSANRRLLLGMILSIAALWLMGLMLVFLAHPEDGQQMIAADVYTRYSLAIPGAVLTVWGLLVQRRKFVQAGMHTFGRDVSLAAAGFGLYGVIGQLFVSRSLIFPSPYINADVFLQWFGFPIQLFRAIMACLAAVFIIRSLRSIKEESMHRIEQLRATQDAERKRLEELRSELLHRTVQAQENERQRIARELHDETGQTLTALGMGLRGMKDNIQNNPDRAIKLAQHLEILATSGVKELQRLVSGLHPPHLDDLGLRAALRWYAGEINQRYNLPVNLHSQGEKPKLTPEMRATIFRIAQEAITNIIRHANASQITISLDYHPDQIDLRISDDGQGFDVDQVLSQQSGNPPAWGLLGILERASLISGTCSILSQPGQGTTVMLTMPIQSEADDD